MISKDESRLLDYSSFVGQRVKKTSGKPFKSGLSLNTVKGVVENGGFGETPAFTFEEDDSLVECRRCIVVSE